MALSLLNSIPGQSKIGDQALIHSPPVFRRTEIRLIFAASLALGIFALFGFIVPRIAWRFFQESGVSIDRSLLPLISYVLTNVTLGITVLTIIVSSHSVVLWNSSWSWSRLILTGLAFALLLRMPFLMAYLQYPEKVVMSLENSFHAQTIETLGWVWGLGLVVVFSVGIVPFLEEAIFRGLALKAFCLKIPAWSANLLQSFLFALFHQGVGQFLMSLVFGLVAGAVTLRSQSIHCSYILHACFNLIPLLFIYWKS